MEQFDSSEEESSRVLEQQQRNDEQQLDIIRLDMSFNVRSAVSQSVEGGAFHDIYILCKLLVDSKHGVSFYNPQLDEGWNECYIPHEVAMKEACRLLFFVITDDTRAVTSMLEVRGLLLDTLRLCACASPSSSSSSSCK